MNEGRVAQIGPPAELYTHPADRFVAEFLGEPNVLTGQQTGVDDGRGRIVLPGGTALRGRLMASVSTMEQVDVLLRPERISIRPDDGADSGANSFEARIELVNFLGDAVELEAAIDSRTPVRVRLPFGSDLQRFAPGDTLRLSAAPEDCLIFPARSPG
jgi:ABC-type Fe3+/spermidine/putrescine transport system ATPase subunit